MERDTSSEGVMREILPEEACRNLSLRHWSALAESWRILRALRETRGNRSAAARNLGRSKQEAPAGRSSQ